MDYDNPYVSPLTDSNADVERQQAQRTGLGWLLFSFQGRIPRRQYWAVVIISTFITNLYFLALLVLIGNEMALWVALALGLPLWWILLAVAVKRWHDRNKSGLWILINLVPYIGPIWMFVECGCLRGTVGPNRYGEDPT